MREGELAHESKRNESERWGDGKSEGVRGVEVVSRANVLHERVMSEGEVGKEGLERETQSTHSRI